MTLQITDKQKMMLSKIAAGLATAGVLADQITALGLHMPHELIALLAIVSFLGHSPFAKLNNAMTPPSTSE